MTGRVVFRGVNGPVYGTIAKEETRYKTFINAEGEREQTPFISYLVKLDNGKYVRVNEAQCTAVTDTPERPKYTGKRFGEGNRVIPKVYDDILIDSKDIII